jgi:hypothetical protein
VRSKEFVHKVLIRILDHLYERQFLDCSHGFRPGRSQHTCLKQIRREFGGALWYIVGDLSCKVLDNPGSSPINNGGGAPGWKRRGTGVRGTGRPDPCQEDRRVQRTGLGFWGQKNHYGCFFPPYNYRGGDHSAGFSLSKAPPLGLVPLRKALPSRPTPALTFTKRMAKTLATRLPLLGFARLRAFGLLTTSNPAVVTHGGRPYCSSTVVQTALHRTLLVRPSCATTGLLSHFIRDSRFNKRLRQSGGLASLGGLLLERRQKGNTSAESLNRPRYGCNQKKRLVFKNSKHAPILVVRRPLSDPYSPLLANMQLHELDKFVLRLKHILEGAKHTTAP